MDLEVVGSRPITHPRVAEGDAKGGARVIPTGGAERRREGRAGMRLRVGWDEGCLAFVAQLDRAPGFEPVGRRFESCRTRSGIIKTGR